MIKYDNFEVCLNLSTLIDLKTFMSAYRRSQCRNKQPPNLPLFKIAQILLTQFLCLSWVIWEFCSTSSILTKCSYHLNVPAAGRRKCITIWFLQMALFVLYLWSCHGQQRTMPHIMHAWKFSHACAWKEGNQIMVESSNDDQRFIVDLCLSFEGSVHLLLTLWLCKIDSGEKK